MLLWANSRLLTAETHGIGTTAKKTEQSREKFPPRLWAPPQFNHGGYGQARSHDDSFAASFGSSYTVVLAKV